MIEAERLAMMRLPVGDKPEVEAFGRLFRTPGPKIGIGNNGLTSGARELGVWSCLEAEKILTEGESGK